MMTRMVSAVLLASLLGLAAGGDSPAIKEEEERNYPLEGRIKIHPKLNVKPTSCRVSIDGGKYIGIPRTDGSFVVHDVPAGTHFLEVDAIGLQFPQLRVHISRKKGGAVQAKLVEETSGGRGDRFNYPFVLEPRGQVAYFDAREQVNIMAMIFRNPTVLMMGFMGLMAWGMPKMMENMDPQELAKMQEEMADSPMSSLMGGAAAGATAKAKGGKKKTIRKDE